MPTTTTCPACRAGVRESDTFCWTCGTPRGGAPHVAAPDRLEVARDLEVASPEQRRRGGSWRVVAPVAVGVLVAAAVAGWWLLKPDDAATTVTAAPSSTPATPSQQAVVRAGAAPSAAPSPAVSPPAQPEPQYPTGVLTPARVSAPPSSPDSADAGGHTTTYAAANLLDADPATAWRTGGSAAGSSLTFTFDAPVRITEVGLVNGFAKTDPYDGSDRYAQGRRVLAVTWTFQGPAGPVTVPQRLTDGDRDLQVVPVPAVVTTSVALTLDEVTRPGGGARFDRTAISDVRFGNG